MAKVRVKKKGNGFVFGVLLIGASLSGLWKNETRFDYHKAALKAQPVKAVDDLAYDQIISYTGAMDQSFTMQGKYVKQFVGYLTVHRDAEIYAWHRKEDDDGVSWTKEWMSHLQKNKRNAGLKKQLRSKTFTPDHYQVDDLQIDSQKVQFVNRRHTLAPSTLELTPDGTQKELTIQDNHFYWDKNPDDQLGDERISYRGRPIPAVATYFGKFAEEKAVAHQAEVKEGIISGMIGDKGILHHLVAGDRDTALASIKSHLQRTKTIVRIVGVVLCCFGWAILFTSITRFLFFIPWIGPAARQLSFFIGGVFGVIFGGLAIVCGFLANQPILLGLVILTAIASITLIIYHAMRSRMMLRHQVENQIGHAPSQNELQELEFIELAHLAEVDGVISADEETLLSNWAKQRSISKEKVAEILSNPNKSSNHSPRESVKKLILYSMADGQIDKVELLVLKRASEMGEVSQRELKGLIKEVKAAA